MLAVGSSGQAGAHNTVTFDGAGADAGHIGLIGDSTLSGVRWWGTYGDLRRYNFVLDAESCRRTVEQSCWSREDFRPDNTVRALQRLAGRWGEVLVVMSGYNDSSDLFDDAVEAVVAEAREQAIPHVIWLTLRTADVSYHDPQQRADANGYREDNRTLYEKAERFGGYLQIADWATYAEARGDWFTYDGVHLTSDGVRGLTTFIADNVDAVLAGASLNPDVIPWATLRSGDVGPTVAEVQQALVDAGVAIVGGADGVYGELTAQAVAEFQQARGLAETGTVDEPTAVSLGVHGRSGTDAEPPRTEPVAGAPVTSVPSPEVSAAIPTDRRPNFMFASGLALAASVAVVGAAALVHRRRLRPAPEPSRHGEPASLIAEDPAGFRMIARQPYDHQQEEHVLTGR
jgi:Putative peptidoglycan binding domain